MRILTPMLAVWTGFVGLSQAASVTTPSNTPVTAPGATAMTGQTVGTQKKTAYEWLKENVVVSYTGTMYGPSLYSLSSTPDMDDSRLLGAQVGDDTVWLWNRANLGWKITPTVSLVLQQRFYLHFVGGFKADWARTRLNFSKTDLLDGDLAKMGLGVNLELPTTASSINDRLMLAPALTLSTDYKVAAGWELGHVLQARYYARLREPKPFTAPTEAGQGDRETNDWLFYGSATAAYNFSDVVAAGFQAQLSMDHKYGFEGINIEDLDLQPQLSFNIGAVSLQPYVSFHPIHFANSNEFQKSTYFGMNISAKLF